MILRQFVLYPLITLFVFIAGFFASFKSEESGNGGKLEPAAIDSVTLEKQRKIDSFMNVLYMQGYFNGQILVSDHGRVIFDRSYGYSNIFSKEPLTESSSFQLASVVKPITATAVLILLEEGKLSLDNDIKMYFPLLPYEGVTIKHLLQHTSGIPDYIHIAGKYWDRSKYLGNKDVLQLLCTFKPKKTGIPGQKYIYSNSGYALLALIIEEVSGLSYDEFVKTWIFDPLGMKNSYVFNPLKDSLSIKPVCGYFFDGVRCKPYNFDYRNGVMGDKGIYTNAYDLFLFDQSLYNNRLLQDKTLKLAYTKGETLKGDTFEYGLGWRMREIAGHPVILHYGFWNSFRTGLVRFPETQSSIIVFNNITGPKNSKINNRNKIVWTISNILFPTVPVDSLKIQVEEIDAAGG